jgi:monofunctional biosynthetic peptidoglycan transglycosylase
MRQFKSIKFIVRKLTLILGGYFALVALLGLIYIFISPVSTLMLGRWISFNEVEHQSIRLNQVNRNVLQAVISAEDDQFCTHHGINWGSVSSALKQTMRDERTRGASTISMQVAKNLFLWPQRSYIRKILEVPITLYIDLIWSKKRMMEIYLSVAQWGNGVFGIEAAAKRYFNKSAAKLTHYEAALLAAALPNPIERNPKHPSAYHRQYAATIEKRMYSGANLSCFR